MYYSTKNIINKSLGEGTFCMEWKSARVKPLIKKQGADLEKSNYCPVSNLPFLSNMVKNAMLKQFSNHCDKYKILPDYQSTYWENYSTEITLLKPTNDILWAMKRQEIMSVTCMDLSAAFDMVDNEILLHVLNNVFGIMDTSLKSFESYLRPRNFRVSVNVKTSAERELPSVFLRGLVLVLPPLNAYASILWRGIPETLSMIGFAGDHVVIKLFTAQNHKEREETTTVIEDCMKSVKSWMDAVLLKWTVQKQKWYTLETRNKYLNAQQCNWMSMVWK